MEQRSNPLLSVPGAIILAGAIVAMAIIWTKKPIVTPGTNVEDNEPALSKEINLSLVTAQDHILGDPNAKILVVEYSDTACPFCKSFHPTMKSVTEEYGRDSRIAWVYRHFPLDETDPSGRALHPNAGKEAEATECAAELGGNTAFWTFTNHLYEVTPSVTQNSPQGLDPAELPKIAEFAGLDTEAFKACLASGKYKDKVQADYVSGLNAGVSGTPHSILVLSSPAPKSADEKIAKIISENRIPESLIFVSPDRLKVSMSGAMPLNIVKALLDALLAS